MPGGGGGIPTGGVVRTFCRASKGLLPSPMGPGGAGPDEDGLSNKRDRRKLSAC